MSGQFEILLDGQVCATPITAPAASGALSHYLKRTERIYPDTVRVGPTEARRTNGKTLTVREAMA